MHQTIGSLTISPPIKPVNVNRHRMTILFRLLLAGTLIFISSQAIIRNGIAVPIVNSDKSLHFLAFCTLAVLLDFAFPRSRFGTIKILSLIGYGILIEFVQSFLPYRSAELADVFADMVGICAYAGTIPLLRRFTFYQEYRQL